MKAVRRVRRFLKKWSAAFLGWVITLWRALFPPTVKRLVVALALLTTVASSFLLVWQWQQAETKGLLDKELANAQRANRDQLIKMATGVFVGIGLYIAYRRVKTTEDGQLTERYTRAIDQLGDDKMEIRLGGIYALERIMKDSKDDRWTIVEVLASYVRKRAPWTGEKVVPGATGMLTYWPLGAEFGQAEDEKLHVKPEQDIQAVLTVLGRRPRKRNESSRVNLAETDLRGANIVNLNFRKVDLRSAHLDGANLYSAHLEGADLYSAHLEGADLYSAHLEGADLYSAHLEGADLRLAHLEGANLRRSHLEGANLWNAHLEGAHLFEAHLEGANLRKAHLEGADLESAHLEGAHLLEAHLEGADLYLAHLEGANLRLAHFEGANLRGAHLEGAKLLTVDQLLKVKTLFKATLDPDREKEVRAQKPELFDYPRKPS